MSKFKDKMKEQLRQRMKESAERKTGGGGDGGLISGEAPFLYTEQGRNYLLDIIPYIAGKNSPTEKDSPKNPAGTCVYTLEYWRHSGLGADEKGKCLCLKTWGYKCPVCEYRTNLIAEGGDDETIKQLQPSLRNAYNVIVYEPDFESKGIMIWCASNYHSEQKIQAQARRVVRPGSDASPTIFFMDLEQGEGHTIQFKQNGKPFFDLEGLKLVPRDYDIPEERVKEAHVLEDFLTNKLPKKSDGSLDLEKLYIKIKAYLEGTGEDEESNDETVKQKEEVKEETKPERPKRVRPTKPEKPEKITEKVSANELAEILEKDKDNENKCKELIEANGWTIEEILDDNKEKDPEYDTDIDAYFAINDFIDNHSE